MQRQTVYVDNTFLKLSQAHVIMSFIRSCRFLMQRGLSSQGSQPFSVGFQPCRSCAEIVLDSLNLLTILWIVDAEIPNFLAC